MFKKTLLPLLVLTISLISCNKQNTTAELAKIYTKALTDHDTTILQQIIKPAVYVPFYAKRFKEAALLETKKINDTLSCFTFNSNKGVIHSPVIKKDNEMGVDLAFKYPKDKYS